MQARKQLVAGVAVMGLLAACAGDEGEAAGADSDEEPIVLGAVLPSTGPVAEWGTGNASILRMLEDEVNDEGGINGRPLDIVMYDSSARPEEAAALVRRLATDANALAILGPFTTSEAEVAFPVANQFEIVSTAQASSAPGTAAENRPWAFRNTLTEVEYVGAAVPAMLEEHDIERVAVAYDASDAVGTAIGESILPDVFEEHGLENVTEGGAITFQLEDADVQAQVSQLASLEPDAIGIGAFYNGAVKILREMERQGLEVPVVGGSPFVSDSILRAFPEVPIYAGGTYFHGIDEAGDWNDRALEAHEANGVDAEPNMFDAQVYEIGQIYLEAIRERGLTGEDLEADRVEIREHLEGLTGFQGITGEISFKDDGDAARDFFAIRGQDGSWEVLSSHTGG